MLAAKTKSGTLVRVFVTLGKKHQAVFALDCAVRCIEFYEKYFGIRYPLPAMDLIAIPDFAAGAMENMLAFPGCDLPGVCGAGGLQTLMNVQGILPGRRTLMVGAGNIGLIVAYQILQAGGEVVAQPLDLGDSHRGPPGARKGPTADGGRRVEVEMRNHGAIPLPSVPVRLVTRDGRMQEQRTAAAQTALVFATDAEVDHVEIDPEHDFLEFDHWNDRWPRRRRAIRRTR